MKNIIIGSILVFLFPTIAYGDWWCGLGNEIVQCELREGIVQPPEDEVFLLQFFGDSRDLMRGIGKCESGNKQFQANGKVIVSPTNDYGYFQINEKIWLLYSKELRLNIMEMRDNFAMARIILAQRGLSAWSASQKCWEMIYSRIAE